MSQLIAGAKEAVTGFYKQRVRPNLPAGRPARYAGIPVYRNRALGDALLPKAFTPHEDRDQPRYEEAIVLALKQYARPGDQVVVVGGGAGVTAAVAALLVRPTGHVTCYEGSANQVAAVQTTLDRNSVRDIVSVRHAIVGANLGVYGGEQGAENVSAEQLPQCDILQLDCEGAERLIIPQMLIEPRVVIVETHGMYGSGTDMVHHLLEARGYRVENRGVAEPLSPSCIRNDVYVLVGVRM